MRREIKGLMVALRSEIKMLIIDENPQLLFSVVSEKVFFLIGKVTIGGLNHSFPRHR